MSTETRPHIEWLQSYDEAVEKAKSTGKLVLLDFFNPG
jgi:hypothetical protein